MAALICARDALSAKRFAEAGPRALPARLLLGVRLICAGIVIPPVPKLTHSRFTRLLRDLVEFFLGRATDGACFGRFIDNSVAADAANEDLFLRLVAAALDRV